MHIEGIDAFHHDLYEEHLEEAAFLFEQRLLLSEDAEVSWSDLADEEARLEAHLDALVIGGPLSRSARAQAEAEDDPGYCHVLVSLFCLEDDFDGLTGYLADRALDELGVLALYTALTVHCPEAWQVPLTATIPDQTDGVATALARFAGARHIAEAVAPLEALGARKELLDVAAIARARIGSKAAIPDLHRIFEARGEKALEAGMTLLGLGDRDLLLILERADDPQRILCYALMLAIAGGPRGSAMPATALAAGVKSASLASAVGIAGDAERVPLLLDLLEDRECAEAAAVALFLITGFEAREEVFVAHDPGEEDDEDDDGPGGEDVLRLTRSPETWRAWWTTNRDRFRADLIYRLGEPMTPAALIESLAAATTPNAMRQWISHELSLRYGIEIHLDILMPIASQWACISRARAAAETGDFEPGRRYRFGEPI